MSETVKTTTKIAELWNGLVIIEEIRTYDDPRGSLTELWRIDDTKMHQKKYRVEVDNSGELDATISIDDPKMCYFSYTEPYVMRGPHQHHKQTDWFYTFFSKMSYHLFNPITREMEIFVTNPEVVTRVKVMPPVVHSYRNLEDTVVHTANFPTSLFMGYDKKGYSHNMTIDEIRWEEKFSSNPTFIVLGANGRLGKELVDTLYDNMGLHEYHVIPVSKKFHTSNDIETTIDKIKKSLTIMNDNVLPKNVFVLNCIAYTNVQESNHSSWDMLDYTNVSIPQAVSASCAEWNVIHFSSDYVYKKEENVDMYTSSKKSMESVLKQSKESTIIRVANLFSKDVDDTHNIICKFMKKEKDGEITIDPLIKIFPTDVSELSSFLIENLLNAKSKLCQLVTDRSGLRICNVIPKSYYNLEGFCEKFFNFQSIKYNHNTCYVWGDDFLKGTDGVPVFSMGSCEKSIINTIKLHNTTEMGV